MPTKYAQSSADKRHEFPKVKRRKAAVLWYLAHHDGIHESKSGRATTELADAVRPLSRDGDKWGGTNFTKLLTELELDELVIRDVLGKRTRSVALVPTPEELAKHPDYGHDPWPRNGTMNGTAVPALTVVAPVNPPVAPVAEKYEPAAPAPPSDTWSVPPVPPNADPHALLGQAMSYIAQAIATSRPVERTDPEVLARLSSTLEDNQRLRAKLSATEDALRSTRDEVGGLRKAKALLEDNLRTIANGRLDEGALRRFRELERFMQTPPNAKA